MLCWWPNTINHFCDWLNFAHEPWEVGLIQMIYWVIGWPERTLPFTLAAVLVYIYLHVADHVVTMASFNPPCDRRSRYLLKCYKIISNNLSGSLRMKSELAHGEFHVQFHVQQMAYRYKYVCYCVLCCIATHVYTIYFINWWWNMPGS